ncbi:PH domain-containing protein [Arsenicicoccus sp. oral taxon 190]|uniref:PH domain-containing protein n=1 Tax=Arsenicicoccus sp. oral taxon 190 TaxID=1658671 RepID=UPI00067DD0D0|nr:PH domain-containing protein [Arsenicicoccus sp. oral taxon 190]
MDPSDEPQLPPSVRRRYVLDGEQLVVAIHQHPVVVAEPVATALAVLVLVIAVDANVSGTAANVVDVLWWVWFAAVARAVWMVWEWRKQWVIATDKRLMMTYGFIIRKVAMMPLSKVTDMSYHRSIAGRIFGWGTFVMESAGQQQALSEIKFVPQPDHNYRALCAEIFGVEDRERVTDVDEDVQEAHDWPDEHDGDRWGDVVQVEPGPARMQRVAGHRNGSTWRDEDDRYAARDGGGRRSDGGRGERERDGWDRGERDRDGRDRDGRDRRDRGPGDRDRGDRGQGRWRGERDAARGRDTRRGYFPPRDGHDTADLPVVQPPLAQDAEARELLSSWERFAERYDRKPERGYDSGTSIYRSGDDPLS